MNDLHPNLRSERIFLATSAFVFLVCAGITIHLCQSMSGGMSMPGGSIMSMAWMRMGQTWPAAVISFIRMWSVMMVAMMLPSLVPALLRYRRAVRDKAGTHPSGLTTVAAAGYFFVWILFGLVIYPVAVSFADAEMRRPAFLRSVPLMAGIALVLAGSVQLTPWKARQLRRCWDVTFCGPVPPTAAGAWWHGLRLGVDCTLCCLGLMTVLLVTGVMSLPTMSIVTAAIAMERLAQNPQRIACVTGIVIVAFGLLLIARALPAA